MGCIVLGGILLGVSLACSLDALGALSRVACSSAQDHGTHQGAFIQTEKALT